MSSLEQRVFGILRMQLILLALVFAIGYFIGDQTAGARILTGRADGAADGGGSIITDEWTYGISGVTWVDEQNTWHDSGTPDCVRVGESVYGLRFAAVEVTVEGSTWKPVVWIDCRSGSPSAGAR